MSKSKDDIKWFDKPEEHNYPAAESYLSLIIDPDDAEKIVNSLRKSKIHYFKAKDIFRSSKLSMLGVSNSHVDKNIDKIEEGDELSPILLVRDVNMRMIIIADGYHRMCGVYHYDEDAIIPCQITNLQ
jgi:disulfide oxidoreductase YuzD